MGSIEPGQLKEWFHAYSAAMVLYARQWLNRPAAEDATQEAFLSLMTQGTRPNNVKAWLFRTLRNAAINQVRSQQRRRKHEDFAAARRAEWFESWPDDALDARQAQAVLEQLAPEQRDVVLLRIWGEMTLAEAAEILGVPASTVFDRYRSALEEIRRRMGQPCEMRDTKDTKSI